MLINDILMRLGLALLLGATIGFERQWRNHYAGLRTDTLITVGSAGLMIFAVMLPGNDPSGMGRIASQIITGVGFLCAGVIMHEGVNVKGLNTSATLWCSTCVGMFAGAGLFAPAWVLTAFIIGANLALRPLVYYINRRTPISEELEAHYTLSVSCAIADAGRMRAAMLKSMEPQAAHLKSLLTKLSGGTAQISADFLFAMRSDAIMETMAAHIGRETGVMAIEWHIQ